MVDKITYSQLAKIAQEQGKNVTEVAAENGISEAELADMKLKDAKLGGELEAPGDVATFSHKAVDINGTKGLVTFYDSNVQDGPITLNDAAKKELGKYGVNGLVAHDGELYAQHKDGNEYPLGNVKDYDLEWANRQKTLMDVAKMFFGASIMPLSLVGALQSCDKIDMAQEEIQITKMKDYSSQLDALSNKLTNIENKFGEEGQKIVAKLEQIISTLNNIRQDNEANTTEIKNAIGQVKAWLEMIENNQETQIQIQVDGFNSFEDFKTALLKVINGHYDDMNKQYNDLVALITKIKDINEQIKENTDIIIEKLDGLKDMFPDLKAAIDNVASKGDTAIELLTLIYDLMQLFPKNEDMKEYTTTIINAINRNGANINGLRALLKQIDNSVKVGTAVQVATARANTAAILAKLNELGFKVVNGTDAIVKAIQDGNMKLDDILTVLNDIKALVTKYGDEGVNIGNQILEAIGKLGNDVTVGFDAVLNAIQNNNENGKAIKALLEQVLANQDTMIKDNRQGFIDVLNAIKGIAVNNGNPDFSKIEALLASINNGVSNNGGLLKNITEQNDTVIMILKSFKQEANDKLQTIINKFGNLEEDVKAGNLLLKLINEKINNITVGGGCNVDFDKLMDMLNKILKAIQDHDVHVTVDGNGKECCCCGTDKPHEGIIGDLENLLG